MGNIINYLHEQGNIPFKESEFNEVDNLVLCQTSYVDFDGIVPSPDESGYITVKDASEAFFEKHTEEELSSSKSLLKTAPLTLKAMSEGQRFKNAKLSNYVNQLDLNSKKQFAALHIELDDDSTYVAFRGTDDNLASWQEAFNLSYEIVPSQIEAANYLEQTINDSDATLRLGGHSKGGNLAIYSAARTMDSIKDRIVEIFNNDGPGFDDTLLQSEGYSKIFRKIVRYTPEFSVFGTLFGYKDKHKIIGNSAKGLKQHDCMNWEVSGNHFVYKNEMSKTSQIISESIGKWVGKLQIDQRKDFIVSAFDELSAKGVLKISDFSAMGTNQIVKLIGKLSCINKPTRVALALLAVSFLAVQGKELVNPILNTFNTINNTRI